MTIILYSYDNKNVIIFSPITLNNLLLYLPNNFDLAHGSDLPTIHFEIWSYRVCSIRLNSYVHQSYLPSYILFCMFWSLQKHWSQISLFYTVRNEVVVISVMISVTHCTFIRLRLLQPCFHLNVHSSIKMIKKVFSGLIKTQYNILVCFLKNFLAGSWHSILTAY